MKNLTIWVLRALFFLAMTGLGFLAARQLSEVYEPLGQGLAPFLMMAILAALALGIIVVDIAFPRKSISTISAIVFGLIVGFILAAFFKNILALTFLAEKNELEAVFMQVFTVVFSFIAITIILQTKDEFRFVIPYVEFAKEKRGERPTILDTSVIIDGRIGDLVETNLMTAPLIIPRFVLQEIHTLADSSIKLKRNRGRRGLDVLNKLQKSEKVRIEINESKLENIDQVDSKLVHLARKMDARVMTTDFNLNKVAQLQGVDVVNLNDVSNAMKAVVLPGESIRVKVIKQGEEIGQGVGYLDDGTMVVIDQGKGHIGEEIQILVTSVLQTSAGRMVFGRTEGTNSVGGSSRGAKRV